MPPTTMQRFTRRFVSSFWKTMRESLYDKIVTVCTVAYFFAYGLLKDRWELVTPFVWTICLIAIYHVFEAAIAVSGEIGREASNSVSERETPILAPSGQHAIVSVASVAPKFYRLQLYSTATIISLLCVCLSLYVGYKRKGDMKPSPPPPPPSSAVAIFADCELASLPLTIAPQSSIHLVSLNQKFMLSQNWGLADISNRTDDKQQWPSKKIMDSVIQKMKENRLHKIPSFPPVFGYKCDVSNHSQVDVLDVALTLRIWFGNKGGEENAVRYTPVLSPIDAGGHFIFYVFNDCPINTNAVLPNEVALTIAGDSVRRVLPLNLPHRSPVEPFMMFFPSDTQWIRQQPCN
jgi:hypothetical protein